jgi:hypothetical protein
VLSATYFDLTDRRVLPNWWVLPVRRRSPEVPDAIKEASKNMHISYLRNTKYGSSCCLTVRVFLGALAFQKQNKKTTK